LKVNKMKFYLVIKQNEINCKLSLSLSFTSKLIKRKYYVK